MKKLEKQTKQAIRIFTDGSGCRPDGKGSGFAWFRENGNQPAIIRVSKEDNLTNNQAEYKAILSAIESVPKSATVEILTDSENTCYQLRGERRVKDPELASLHAKIRAEIEKNRLSVTFTWIPRRDNKAGRLI